MVWKLHFHTDFNPGGDPTSEKKNCFHFLVICPCNAAPNGTQGVPSSNHYNFLTHNGLLLGRLHWVAKWKIKVIWLQTVMERRFWAESWLKSSIYRTEKKRSVCKMRKNTEAGKRIKWIWGRLSNSFSLKCSKEKNIKVRNNSILNGSVFTR